MRSVNLGLTNQLFAGDILKNVPYCDSIKIKIFIKDGKFDYVPETDHLFVRFVLAKWTVEGYELQEDISI